MAPATETVSPSGRMASERVARQGLPPFQSTGRVLVDRFAEGDLKAGGNDLANGEAQGNLVAKADERRIRRRRSDFRV